MSAHTTGPWRHMLMSEKSWNVGIYDTTGTTVAVVKVSSVQESARRDADARLIAAAPELLKFVQNWLDGGVTHAEAKALIAKVEAA